MAFAFAYYFLKTTWAMTAGIVAIVIAALWLGLTWKRRAELSWVGAGADPRHLLRPGDDPAAGRRHLPQVGAGDPLPAILLGGYALLGALIYLVYGLHNSGWPRGSTSPRTTPAPRRCRPRRGIREDGDKR